MTNLRLKFPAYLLVSAALALAFCKYAQKTTAPAPPATTTSTDMPKSPATAHPPGDYAAEWAEIDSLQNQGLFKSALERTDALLTRARADRNTTQVVKALIFKGKFTTMLEEDGFVKAVAVFEQEEKTTTSALEKAVLQSMLGELYATYLQNQAWRVQQRTPIPDGEGGDILTWSAAQMERRALECYAASVQRIPILLETPAATLGPVLMPGQNDSIGAEALRPSVFDFLAHRALEHFANERSYLTEPAYKFYLSQPEAFAPRDQFVKAAFESRDSTSGKWLAIRLFQDLLRSESGNTAALASNDLLRLQFAKNNTTLEDKHTRYLTALELLHKTYYTHPVDAEIVLAIAEELTEQDRVMSKSDGALLKRAVAECESAIARFPGTYGGQQCANWLSVFRRPALSMEIEHVNLPDRPVLFSLSFQNLKQVRTKVVSIPNDPTFFNQMDWNARLGYLNSLPAVQQRRWDLADPGDYRLHHTELKLDALPAGRYAALVSVSEKFGLDSQLTSFVPFTCSKLAGINFRREGDNHFAVTNRETGQPLAGVQADLYEYRWNRNEQRHVRNLLKQLQSDRDGLLHPDVSQNVAYQIRLSQEGDTLWFDEQFNNYPANRPESRREVQFFTDRALYRPGQMVYFKGIVLERDEKGFPKIVPNLAVTVSFIDANGQRKSDLKLRSNEFGTFNGAFSAPTSGLTGQMHLEAEGLDGSAWFNVEEYKRPRFEVTFKPLEGAYRVNETVRLRGEAKNYAGSNVDGAAVRYRVVRQARFPWWDWWSKIRPWNTESMEIANGETSTNANGSFDISFTALADPTIPKKDQPVFDYTVMADVTDITGETRSGQTNLTVGYVALNVNFDLPAEIELDSLRRVGLRTTNSAGQFQAATGTIRLQPLVEPKKLFVQRYWEDPDILTLTESEFRRDFPNYPWNGEENPEKWDRPDVTRTIPFNTASGQTADLLSGGTRTGYYAVTLQTQDAFGEPVEIKRIVRVWTAADRRTQFDAPAGLLEKNTCMPGETARLWLGAKGGLFHFLMLHEQADALQKPRWMDVTAPLSVDFPVQERDRGGFSVGAFGVKNNRFYSVGMLTVQVPWDNKDLTVKYETFRDKLLPGQKEEWRIRISGPKKEKVAAEMAAALYDASLDQFLPHRWAGMQFPGHWPRVSFFAGGFSHVSGEMYHFFQPDQESLRARVFSRLNWFDFPLYGGGFPGRMLYAMDRMAPAAAGAPRMEAQLEVHDLNPFRGNTKKMDAAEQVLESTKADGAVAGAPAAPSPGGGQAGKPEPPAPRRNLNETVFFFPELRTDAEGNVVLRFTMNEALTRWKFLAFAHTKELQWALSEKSVVTQKDLMIITNPPRFVREGDELEFSAKVSNLSQQAIEGTATLKLFDAASMAAADADFGLAAEKQRVSFSVPAGQSVPVFWRLKIPEGKLNGLTWQVFAEGKTFTDGEENTLPVLTNRMLVTETLPITVRGNQKKTVVFENLKNTNSNTLRTQRYTLEFTSNPAWYAVQSLPYLMEFPYECTEQMFSRFYANTLASSVTEKMPNIRKVYERWKGTDAMKSNLSKNQELKTALLEETPWVMDAQSEEQQKQQIALLFDLNRMADEQERVLSVLSERQAPNGGWPWFPGGQEDWYITQHIAAGFGHLDKLGAFSLQNDPRTAEMWENALRFCDSKLAEHYRRLEEAVQKGQTKLEDDHLDGMVIHYLYARSFKGFDGGDKRTNYYLGQAEKYWLGKGLYQEGLLALALHRAGRREAAARIVASLRERALQKEELGMYWPFDWGMYWYQLPVETQALMVEVFDEVAADAKAVEELRVWLLKNKQTNRWESTKATAEAVYALLLHGDNWLQNTRPVQVSLGGKTLKPAEYEPGTGYFKQSWGAAEVKSSWHTISVENPNSNLVWGAAYWQYFEDLDKIKTFKKTPLTMVKQLFREENSPTGPVLKPIAEGQALHRGDKLKVRIEIRVDRAMEYVHLKDMRASGLEPTNVLSGYRWQDGLGYYESTKDLATHFFIDYLPRGTFVFEYPLVVNHRGDFSNGITTLQCMYAPEFTSHSEGVRVKVE